MKKLLRLSLPIVLITFILASEVLEENSLDSLNGQKNEDSKCLLQYSQNKFMDLTLFKQQAEVNTALSLKVGDYTYKAALLCSNGDSIGLINCNGEKVNAGLFNGKDQCISALSNTRSETIQDINQTSDNNSEKGLLVSMPAGENCFMDNSKTNLIYKFICDKNENSIILKDLNKISYCEYEFDFHSKYACEGYLVSAFPNDIYSDGNKYLLLSKNIRTGERQNINKAPNESRIYLFLITSAVLLYFLFEALKSIIHNNFESNESIFFQNTCDVDYDYCELSEFENKYTIASKKV